MLFSIAYFPPVEYFALMFESSVVYMEACENYQKQSYRNRCSFYAADGVQNLNFPIVHEGGTSTLPITEIKIDYSTPWVIRTERAITSAYQNSAFFEFYKDELFAILDSQPETLFELNMSLIHFFIKKIGIPVEIKLTKEYISHLELSPELAARDFRDRIHPKKSNNILESLDLNKPYYQVFAEKYGFKSGLSIMDLLFNEGPESSRYLCSEKIRVQAARKRIRKKISTP